jgi:RND family efflux transporter MFP subunit
VSSSPNHAEIEGAADGAAHDLGFSLPPPASFSRGRLLLVGLVAVSLLGAAFTFAYLPKRRAAGALAQSAAASREAVPRVSAVTPKLVADGHTLRLSGNVTPLEEAVIYARSNGYVRRWLVDIGTRVKEGALLAEIDTPEIDQELSQGRAALAQARANLAQTEASRTLAKSRLDRTGNLVEAGVAPAQDLDQTRAEASVGEANVNVAEAAVAAQQANIQRLRDLQGFSRVTAPFAGVITARSIERGSLVTAGTGTPLFRLASTDIVRVFIQVPQSAAPGVQPGMPSKIEIREFPGRVFEGKVARTAGALDSSSRTLNTEIQVPNPDGKLLAGMYAEVQLTLTVPRRVYELPATALMNDADGLRVAVVTPENTLKFRKISLERDLGATVQVRSGIEANDRVVQIASVDLTEGERVQVTR